MTPVQFQIRAAQLCRKFKPISEKPETNSLEFKFSGWRVHLQFSHRGQHSGHRFSDWIHIGINNPYELPPFCDHWKWNIHYSGNAAEVRSALLSELERRLGRLAEHYNHVPA